MLRFLCPAVLVALSLGCGGSSKKPVHPVQGQVRYQGRPTPQAVVILHPEDAKDPAAPRPIGHVDDKGNFALTSYASDDGAPEGTYRVSVSWHLASRVPGRADETVTQNYLPARYGNPDTSNLRVTITKGSNRLDPITLTR